VVFEFSFLENNILYAYQFIFNSSIEQGENTSNTHAMSSLTCNQALFSFRSVKHSGGTGETKNRGPPSPAAVVGREGMISGYEQFCDESLPPRTFQLKPY